MLEPRIVAGKTQRTAAFVSAGVSDAPVDAAMEFGSVMGLRCDEQ
jgi:hypothetical protein